MEASPSMSRRAFTGVLCGSALALAGMLSACNGNSEAAGEGAALPSSQPDPDSQFGVDKTINMATIDEWIGRDDVAYRDVRLVLDPGDYAAMGGSSLMDFVLEGFKVVPLPYVATLPEIPIDGAYRSDTLFDVSWNEDYTVADYSPNYEQSMTIVEDLFPRDRPLFIMCGGGGYASFMKNFLIALGWDESLLYNVGGAWDYEGGKSIQVAKNVTGNVNDIEYFLWRLDMATLDFSQYTPV